jgi:glycerol-3-phosphate dehydrogenase
VPLTPADVAGTYAGLRPLVDGDGKTADLSRRHAVIRGGGGLVSVVGGKLTTYRRMAEDTLDSLVADGRLDAGPCRTADLPLLRAARAPVVVNPKPAAVAMFRRVLPPGTPILNWGCPGRAGEPVAAPVR